MPAAYEQIFWQKPVTEEMREFSHRFTVSRYFNAQASGLIQKGEMTDYLLSLYDAKIRYTDDALGDFLKGLTKLGLSENTLILLTSDHGEELMDHGNFFHEQSLYEELVHVPLLMRFPGVMPENKIISDLVRHMDVMPTVLEVLDIPLRPTMQGRSLVSLIKKENIFKLDAFSEAYYGGKHWKGIRTARWKFIEVYDVAKNLSSFELYDLKSDPKELNNLAIKSSEELRSFQAQLKDYVSSCASLRDSFLGEGFTARPVSLDEETKEKLKSLGYIQ